MCAQFSQFVQFSEYAHFHLWHNQLTQKICFLKLSRMQEKFTNVFFSPFDYWIYCLFRCHHTRKVSRFAIIMSSSIELVCIRITVERKKSQNSPKMKPTLLREHKALECQKRTKKIEREREVRWEYGKYIYDTDDTRTELFRNGYADFVCLPRTPYTTGKWIQ